MDFQFLGKPQFKNLVGATSTPEAKTVPLGPLRCWRGVAAPQKGLDRPESGRSFTSKRIP